MEPPLGGKIACDLSLLLEAADAEPPMPHLLLVDDDDLFREFLGLNLIDEGYEVTSSATAGTLWPISMAAAGPTSSCWIGACRA